MNRTEEKMDTIEKEFMAFPDIAADTINALLYQGDPLADAENLWPGPTETIYQGRERLRDQYEGKVHDIFPVIEMVLYWGRPRWRSSRDIRQLFAKRRLPEKIWKYIDRISLHVFEMRHLPEETRQLFHSDMRIAVDYLAEGKGTVLIERSYTRSH